VSRPYVQPGLTLTRTGPSQPDLVRALQRDLRALGYKEAGIDGIFGPSTERALRALQTDLLKTVAPDKPDTGLSRYNGADGARVARIDGALDQPLAQCIATMLADADYTQVPESGDSIGDNARALAAVRAHSGSTAPTAFVVAIIRQESGGRHYQIPTTGSADAFVTVGLDRNNPASPDEITSRGYGLGQYTLFHHPPAPAEMRDLVQDPVNNVQNLYALLRKKLDRSVTGPDDRADDRTAEHPLLPLRICCYQPSDPRYMADCANCALKVRKIRITPGMPLYPGAASVYEPDQYYSTASYDGVPDRAEFLCDWPYAVRRYNGSGLNSFHYQTRVLRNLLTPP
jgi:peptidoglycan hydrolase-like protein with peptidoglycan-binding domain